MKTKSYIISMDLRLNLKAKWYDMIESGLKKEEYREIKPYWLKRLTSVDKVGKDELDKLCANPDKIIISCYFKKYDTVTFVYGYTKRQMTFKVRDISINTGITKWGAEPDKEYFIICIGDRVK